MHYRWRLRVSSFVVGVAALALALSGCGGGGNSRMSLLEKWQSFADGTPTLRMTNAQVSDAWRAAARRSTDSLLFHVEGVRNVVVPGGDELPFVVDGCSPGECDLPDSNVAFAPVLEHNGVPVAKAEGRATLTEEGETSLYDLRIYGGWLDHTQFRVTDSRWCTVGAPGCSGTDPDYEDGSISGFAAGNATGTPPTGMGSATCGPE